MLAPIGSALPRIEQNRVDPTGLATPTVSGAASGTSSPLADFSSVMKGVAADAIQTMKEGEKVSIQGINGKASTQAVVDAVMSAERTLQTAVTLRDKVVSAYLEVSRMAI